MVPNLSFGPNSPLIYITVLKISRLSFAEIGNSDVFSPN